MYALIKDNELIGTSNINEGLEEGITTIEYDDSIVGILTLDNGSIRAKTKKELKADETNQAEVDAWNDLRGKRNGLLREAEMGGKGLPTRNWHTVRPFVIFRLKLVTLKRLRGLPHPKPRRH